MMSVTLTVWRPEHSTTAIVSLRIYKLLAMYRFLLWSKSYSAKTFFECVSYIVVDCASNALHTSTTSETPMD